MLELFRVAGAILLAYDVIISERAGTQVGQYDRVSIFRQARLSRFSEAQQSASSINNSLTSIILNQRYNYKMRSNECIWIENSAVSRGSQASQMLWYHHIQKT